LLINISSPHPRIPAHPFTPEVLRNRECAPTPSPFVVFTFVFTIESIKELGVRQVLLDIEKNEIHKQTRNSSCFGVVQNDN
jgi:hypothetical protein